MSKKLSLPKDLQQARLDEKWTDLKAIFDAWAAKLTNVSDEIEIYRCLILGESSLEQSLCEKKHQARELGADETFKKSRDYLVQGLQLCNKSIERFGHIAPEFYLLLAKYYYFVDDIINALQSIDKSGITIDNVEELTKRCCILAAEAYCFKGKILEKFSTEKEESSYENAIAAYQLSAELALWIFTDDYKSTNLRKPQETVSHKPMPSGLLTSFCRPVQIELKQGSIHDAIGHCRLFLRIVETNGTVALRRLWPCSLPRCCYLAHAQRITTPLLFRRGNNKVAIILEHCLLRRINRGLILLHLLLEGPHRKLSVIADPPRPVEMCLSVLVMTLKKRCCYF